MTSAADTPSVAGEIERQRRILATALSNAVNVLNPSAIVLGGFLSVLAELDNDALVQAVRAQAMPACGEDLRILPAELAEHRLLIGAAESVFAEVLANPSPA